MPQLSYNGLDLVWLIKECGNHHWNLLGSIKNSHEQGQRLYASFFYIEVDFLEPYNQSTVKEDDIIKGVHRLYKFNRQIYRSKHKIILDDKHICTLTMDTIFVRKHEQSNSLMRGTPDDTDIDITHEISLDHHKAIKKTLASTVPSGNYINFSPEFFFNGAKILYCANYLHLVGISEFLAYKKSASPITKLIIYFFNNLAPEDNVLGHSIQTGIRSQTTLYKSSGEAMCQAFIDRC